MKEYLGTVPQWFSLGIALLALCVGWRASVAWQKTLIAKRGDDLLIAAYEVAGQIGKVRSAVIERNVPRNLFGPHIDELHSSLRELRKTYAVAQRSYGSKLPDSTIADIISKIDRMGDSARLAYDGNERPNPTRYPLVQKVADEAQGTVDRLCADLKAILK